MVKQTLALMVAMTMTACGGEEPKRSSTAAAAKKAPDARMTKSLAQAARTRSMPAGARAADPRLSRRALPLARTTRTASAGWTGRGSWRAPSR